MPELPEVETIRQDLVKKILNKKIARVVVYKPRSVANEKVRFVRTLEGNAISQIDRRGKLMIFWFKHSTVIPSVVEESRQRSRDSSAPRLGRVGRNDKSVAVLVHLKMTGQLIYIRNLPPPRPAARRATPPRAGGEKIEIVAGGHKLSEKDIDALPNKWTRIAFVFADGGELFFNDLRLFGYMKLTTQDEVNKALKKYGPEPLSSDFKFDYFSSLFKKRKNTNLKALLLNQELIAGLGNIYVDEVCFVAGVKPTRRVGSVSKKEQKKLFICTPKILQEALKHRGTTFRNFLDSSGRKGNYTDFLKVYDRDGKPCKKCQAIILKTKAAQRGTHYCPKCQR